MAKSEVDTFLDSVNGPKKGDSFLGEEADPLAILEQAPKDEVVEEDVKEGDVEDKPLPYHKDPKLQRYIEKQVGKRIKEIKPAESATAPEGSDALTDTLIEIIGNDTPQKVSAVKKFRAELSSLEERGAQRALREIAAQAEEERAQEKEAYDTLTSAFEEIEEQNGVDFTSTQGRKMRNDFVDFIARISPKDAEGNIKDYPDMQEAWTLFSSTRKPVENKRAKDLAARGMTRSSDAIAAPAKGQTWRDIDRIFSKLQK